jgi:glutaredoxin
LRGVEMKLTVFTGKRCPKCPAAKELCQEVAEQKGLEYEEFDVEDNMFEALQNQVASTPSILVDGNLLFRDAAPSKDELINAIDDVVKKK